VSEAQPQTPGDPGPAKKVSQPAAKSPQIPIVAQGPDPRDQLIKRAPLRDVGGEFGSPERDLTNAQADAVNALNARFREAGGGGRKTAPEAVQKARREFEKQIGDVYFNKGIDNPTKIAQLSAITERLGGWDREEKKIANNGQNEFAALVQAHGPGRREFRHDIERAIGLRLDASPGIPEKEFKELYDRVQAEVFTFDQNTDPDGHGARPEPKDTDSYTGNRDAAWNGFKKATPSQQKEIAGSLTNALGELQQFNTNPPPQRPEVKDAAKALAGKMSSNVMLLVRGTPSSRAISQLKNSVSSHREARRAELRANMPSHINEGTAVKASIKKRLAFIGTGLKRLARGETEGAKLAATEAYKGVNVEGARRHQQHQEATGQPRQGGPNTGGAGT
jgi:hypothetical protein